MGLDIYVTPFSRFLTGDTTSQLESVLTPAARKRIGRIGSPRPAHLSREVREVVARIRQAIRIQAGRRTSWDEASRFQYSRQYDYRAYAYLRAFAASRDFPDIELPKSAPDQLVSRRTYRHAFGEIQYSMLSRGRPPYPARRVATGKVRPFSEKEDPLFHRSFVRTCEKRKTSFPHLIHHGDNTGCWIPVDFRRPVVLSYSRYEVVGSSVRLLEELGRVGRVLGLKRDWAQLKGETSVAAEDDPLSWVKYGWAVLHACARLSVAHQVPVILDG